MLRFYTGRNAPPPREGQRGPSNGLNASRGVFDAVVNGCCVPAHSMGAASLYKSMGAASLYKSMGAASLYKSMGTASLHKSMGGACLHNQVLHLCTSQWVLHHCTSQWVVHLGEVNGCSIPEQANGCCIPAQSSSASLYCKTQWELRSFKCNGSFVLHRPTGTVRLHKSMDLLLVQENRHYMHCNLQQVRHPCIGQWELHPCVCERERDRERQRKRVCVCMCVSMPGCCVTTRVDNGEFCGPQPGNANVTFVCHNMPKVTFAFAFPGLWAVCYTTTKTRLVFPAVEFPGFVTVDLEGRI